MAESNGFYNLDRIMSLKEWVIAGRPNPLSREAVTRMCKDYLNSEHLRRRTSRRSPARKRVSATQRAFWDFREFIEHQVGEVIDPWIVWQIFKRREEFAHGTTTKNKG